MRKAMLVSLLMVMTIAGAGREVQAAEIMCFSNYIRCNYRAAAEGNFWIRAAMGLDCEINLFGCLREVTGF